MKVFVVIPAAGLGTRMSAPASGLKSKSKQFFELQGTPILIHTLRKFDECARVTEIVVALRGNEKAGFESLISAEHFASRFAWLRAGSTARTPWPTRYAH